ncbi:MAG: hypothetical protein AB7R77_18245 [Ilumatobacteraceae bacterium]
MTTLAVGAAAIMGAVAVELDPAGGDVECWLGPVGEPGLIRVAGALRHTADPSGVLAEHAVEAYPGLRVVLAPTGGEQAASTLMAIGNRLAGAMRGEDGSVVLDGGRWSRAQPTAGRLAGCDVVAVALAPTLGGVAHSRGVVAALRDSLGVPVIAVLIGDRGYSPDEIAGELAVPVAGSIAWDPRGAHALITGGPSRWWRRSAHGRSIRSFVDALAAWAPEEVAARA